jgi:hypothetical protein
MSPLTFKRNSRAVRWLAIAIASSLVLVACENAELGGGEAVASQYAGLSLADLQAQRPRTANPYLALLPPGAQPDYEYWAAYRRAEWAARGFRRTRRPSAALVSTSESESNNTQASADPVTGFGTATDGQARLSGSLTSGDRDFYSFSLRQGDVIAAAVTGVRTLELRSPSGTLLVGSENDISFLYPPGSPLPGDRAATSSSGAALAYVVQTAGTYALSITGGTGSYQIELEAYRTPLEASGTQVVFVDFDGAQVDPSIYGGPPGARALSPLSAFLPGFGLSAQDESAVIDAIMASVRESLSADLASRGSNPRFAIDLRNSRDHLDPGDAAGVSRIVVGGTIEQLGFETIGIAQSIDVGNFALQENAVVLLDLLSAPSGSGASLQDIPRAPGVSMIQLVGTAVGNIVAHEAGHYLGDYHTTNENTQPNIMDEGGDLANTLGLGPDGVFGTADDSDVDFGVDTYSIWEGFTGIEDTLNTVALATSGQAALGRLTVNPLRICNSRLTLELRDGNRAPPASVSITSSAGERETLALTAVATEPGLFRGGIDARLGAAAIENGRLDVQHAAIVTVSYQDPNNGQGSAVTVTSRVDADCQGPAITAVQPREMSDVTTRVMLQTSELATARVDYGLSCSTLNRTVSSALALEHDVLLTGLAPDTSYFFAVTGTDTVGNVVRADNGGACFTFRTAGRTVAFAADFGNGLSGFTTQQIVGDVGWRRTSACESVRPGHSAPSSLAFGRDDTCTYASEAQRSAGTVTSPTFAVTRSAVTKLRFNYLLETQQFYLYDIANVELSVNGGAFQVLRTNRDGTLPETATWTPLSIDLYPYIGGTGTANVTVRFTFDTVAIGGDDFLGFYVDDVEVVALSAGSECTSSAQCNDGVFCNGVEACATGRCTPGRAACDDAVGCTQDRCDEELEQCVNAPQVYYCIDDVFCDGLEICTPGVGCVAPGNPCSQGDVCSNESYTCDPPCIAAPLFESFEANDLAQFEATATVTVNTSAGDRPGRQGTRGADIDDSGSITSYPIAAASASALSLSYYMDVSNFDSGEYARVQYCTANCASSTSWTTLTQVGGNTGWRQYQHTLPSGARTDTLQLRWVSTGNGLSEWVHIDDIVLRDTTCSAPLPPVIPHDPVLGTVNVEVDGAIGEVVFSGTASDLDNDLFLVEVYLSGPELPFIAMQASGTTQWSTFIYLQPGEYLVDAAVFDRTFRESRSASQVFTVPNPNDVPPEPPGPAFTESFEQSGLSQFTSQGAVTVNSSAGDRPGASGTLGADIDDSGRIVTRAIDASGAADPLVLQYWMDVSNFDSGELARVAYCAASCTVESNWVQLAQVGGNTGWRSYQHTLPAAARTATLQLRWVSNASGLYEWVHIDDIVLGGL